MIDHAPRCQRRRPPIFRWSWAGGGEFQCPECGRTAAAPDTRGESGRFAIGGQAKLAALTGAAYTVEVAQPLGRGLRGIVVLRVAKDRPGSVRGHCGPMRPSDRTQEAARLIIDSTGPRPVVTVEAPRNATGDDPRPWRPTAIMESVSRLLEAEPEPLSFNGINTRIRGREQHVRAALDLLTGAGCVTVTDGPNRSRLHSSVRPYRQADDPESDAYREPSEPAQDAGDTGVPPSGVSVSHPYTGGWETDTDRLRETPGRHRETPAQECHTCPECSATTTDHKRWCTGRYSPPELLDEVTR